MCGFQKCWESAATQPGRQEKARSRRPSQSQAANTQVDVADKNIHLDVSTACPCNEIWQLVAVVNPNVVCPVLFFSFELHFD